MINKGATKWNGGLYGACYGGHKELARLMISKGADDLDGSLYTACRSNHLVLAELLVMKGAPISATCLYYACKHNNLKLIELLTTYYKGHWNSGLEGACTGGHNNLIKLMIDKGATSCYRDKSISSH